MALAHKPSRLSHAEATCLPVAGLEALHFLRKAHLQGGEKMLINGAGGGIGTVAVQLARHYGARSDRGGQRRQAGDAALARR